MNYKGIPIKRKPAILNLIPWLSDKTIQGIAPYIWVPKTMYNQIEKDRLSIVNESILIHEATHIKRQRQSGLLVFGFKYVLNSRFRYDEELAAVKSQMVFLKKNKVAYDIHLKALRLSSWLYLWCTDFETAKNDLTKMWDNSL